jgi:adenosylhomocysteine nucleosidase
MIMETATFVLFFFVGIALSMKMSAAETQDFDKVLLVACEPELEKMSKDVRVSLEQRGWLIVFTGVGKINAALAAQRVRYEYPWVNTIVNVGTAGSQTHPVGALVVPDQVAERDMDATLIMRQFVPDYPKHLTPFMEEIFGKIDLSNFVLPDGVRAIIGGMTGTGDNTHAHLEESDYLWDAVEMELAGIVRALKNYNGCFYAVKWISDGANDDAGADWEKNKDGIPWDDVVPILIANE